MEDIFVTKIVETENQAEQIVADAKENANKILEECRFKTSQERKQLEKNFDDALTEKQESLKHEFEDEFSRNLVEMEKQVAELKIDAKKNYETALVVLLSGESGDGNS